MIVNEIAKFENPLILRDSSWAYPSACSMRRSLSWCSSLSTWPASLKGGVVSNGAIAIL